MSIIRAAVAAVALLSLAAGAWAAEPEWIQLRDGVRAHLLSAIEQPASGKTPKALSVSFGLSDPAAAQDHTKIIEVADQLFARVVLAGADSKGFKLAIVNILRAETKSGDATVQDFEDFRYVRGENAVWLRQAGREKWKVAQNPKDWEPPQGEQLNLGPLGTVTVDFFGEVFAPPGVSRALGIELRSSTPATNIPVKYLEIKALWEVLDHEKLKSEGFDLVAIENYGEPRRGRFHARLRVYLNIARPGGGDWPALPDQPPMGDKPALTAGLSGAERGAEQLAASAVLAAVPVAQRTSADSEITSSVGFAQRSHAGIGASALEYLTPR